MRASQMNSLDRRTILAGMASLWIVPERLGAQQEEEEASAPGGKEGEHAVTFWATRKLPMRFGLTFYANDNNCTRLHATIPFPTDWPEQKVRLISAELPPGAVHQMRPVMGGGVQLVVDAPTIPAQGVFQAIMTVEVEKSFTKAPQRTEGLQIPKKVPKELNWYMGDSPQIDTKDRAMKKVLDQLEAEAQEGAWLQVEQIYDWVRENIEYRQGELRSTKDALKERVGDCEEMTGLFVAMCRSKGVPARCVWIPNHCYAEFYLVDPEGEGHWYPCQLAGDRMFGSMNEYRPILQKGDRFKVPEEQGFQRYLREFFTCKHRPVGPREPSVKTLTDLGELSEEIDQLTNAQAPKEAPDSGDDNP